MCFSAAASFASGGILALAGIATLRQASSPAQWPFAAIPCLFAVQQCAEGLIWLGVQEAWTSPWRFAPMYIFLVFAQLVWPVWIPMAIRLIAPPERRRPLGMVLALGCGVSLVLAACMISYGADAEIVGHHIAYSLPYPHLVTEVGGLLYGVAVIAPPFMSGIRSMGWLGAGIAVAYLASSIVYQYYVVSVWCYISALLSVLIFAIQRVNAADHPFHRAPEGSGHAAAHARSRLA
jgi:hypothetical protein